MKNHRILRTILAILAAAGAALDCGATYPGPFKVTLEKISGDEQLIPLLQPMSEPLVVRAVDEAGRPAAGFTVVFVPQCLFNDANPPPDLTPAACVLELYGQRFPVVTDAEGYARSPVFVANGYRGR